MIQSIEFVFGSQLMVWGFLFNNELIDFLFRLKVDGELIVNWV